MYETIMTGWISVLKNIFPLDYTIIRSDALVGSGAIKPNGKFITLKLIAGPNDQTNDEMYFFPDNENFMRMRTAKNFTMSFNFYREDALDSINLFRLRLFDPEIVDLLKENGKISVSSRGGVVDLSNMLETGYDRRYQIDIGFAVGMEYVTTIGWVEKVDASMGNIN